MASRHGPVEVTRLEYNEQAGADTPEEPEIPEHAVHVWRWWWELNRRRQPGFENVAPLSYTEIRSWILLTGQRVAPEEIDWLIQMDNAWLSAISEEREAKRERDKEESERKKGR